MNKKILLLGGVLPVLHLLRRIQPFCLKVEVISCVADVVVNSRFGTKKTYNSSVMPTKVIRHWIEEKNAEKGDWLVIPCSEMFLEYVGVFHQAGYQVFASAEDTLSVFADKKKFYPWLNSIGVYTGESFGLDDSLDFSNSKRYIIKAAKALPEFEGRFKTAIVSTNIEFQKAVEKIPRQYRDGYIIQQIYNGSESLSYGGVWLSGKEIAGVVVKQIRQYPKGVTSAAKIHRHNSDVALIKSIIKKISEHKELNGFVELEFIKNETGLIPIDLNPRLWGWSSFLFVNYPGLAESVVAQKGECLRSSPIDSWSNFWRDVPAIIKQEAAMLEKAKTLASLCKFKHIEFICWHDIKPEFSFLIKRTL